jgi:hypothetical protein
MTSGRKRFAAASRARPSRTVPTSLNRSLRSPSNPSATIVWSSARSTVVKTITAHPFAVSSVLSSRQSYILRSRGARAYALRDEYAPLQGFFNGG